MSNWESFIKKYVWDDNKTPYRIPAKKLNKYQADHELFFYALLVVILFLSVSVISLTDRAPHGKSYGVALYAFSIACSAFLFGATKHVYAACYLALAPLAALGYFLVEGFPPNMASSDQTVLIVVCLALLWYSLRVVAIAQAYPRLPNPPEDQ